jgi:hypothetical protein
MIEWLALIPAAPALAVILWVLILWHRYGDPFPRGPRPRGEAE